MPRIERLIDHRAPEAIREYQTARTMNPESTPALTGLGVAYAKSGNRAEALNTVHSMEIMATQSYVSPVYIGLVYDALGDRDREFASYEKGYDDRAEWLLWLTLDPMFDQVRPSAVRRELAHLGFFDPTTPQLRLPHLSRFSSGASR